MAFDVSTFPSRNSHSNPTLTPAPDGQEYIERFIKNVRRFDSKYGKQAVPDTVIQGLLELTTTTEGSLPPNPPIPSPAPSL